MPVKGWKTITVKEATYLAIENAAKNLGKSMAETVEFFLQKYLKEGEQACVTTSRA